MLRKLIFVCFFISTFSYAQFNQDAPWMKDIKNTKNQTSKDNITSIDEISEAFNEYWINKDYKKKGSGYKPFKRWENYWTYFVDQNGKIPSAKSLWESWKNKSESTAKVNEVSNWTALTPDKHGAFTGRLPGQGRVNAVAVDPNNPNIWYAGAPAGGIWKSTNAGSSWVNLFDDFMQIGVSGIAIDPNDSNIIYIATGDDDAADSYSIGVYKSLDGGATWNETGLNPSNTGVNFLANEITIDPSNSNTIWVATNSGLMKSIDAGATWSVKQGGNIKDFKLKPGNSNTIYAVSSNQYFKSIDGNTFIAFTSTLPASSGRLVLGTSAANPAVVYILSANTSANSYAYQGLYKSTDSGVTFTKTTNTTDIFESNQAWFDLALEVSPTNANELYVGCLNVWKSTNGGTSFIQKNNWSTNNQAYTHADIHSINFFNNKLFVGSDGGVYVSENGGDSFTDKTSNMAISQFYRISVAERNAQKVIGGLQDNGGHIHNGNQWNTYHGGDGMDNVIDPNNDNLLYGFTQNGGSLNISTDSGQSIGFVGPPKNADDSDREGNWITPLAISSAGDVYSGFDAVYKLVGNSWEKISNVIGVGNIDDLEVDPNNSMNIYAIESNGIYRSTNGGANFSLITSLGSEISDLTINRTNGNILYATTSKRIGTAESNQTAEADRGVFKITINGNSATSENITYNLPTNQAFFSIIHQGRNTDNPVFVGTSLGVYRIDDTLSEWEDYFTNLPSVAIGDLEISLDDEIITAATYGRGIWQSPIPIKKADDDIRLTSASPITNAVLCGEITPEILVENKGINDITSITVNYGIEGETAQNFIWTGVITSGQSQNIILPNLSTSVYGKAILNAQVIIANDTFSDNNEISNTFFVNRNGIGNTINTFDTPEEILIAYTEDSDEFVWEKGIPTGTLLNQSGSGKQVYATNLAGNHPDKVKAILLSNCYELSSITAPVLKFKMAYDLELNWDIVYVQYSTTAGATWNVLGNINSQPNWYTSDRTNASSGIEDDCQNCPGAQWTGTNAIITEYSYDFIANAALGEIDLTNESNIIFRIVFHSDAAVNQEGVVIDDFQIQGVQDDDDDDNDGILDVNDNCPLIANANQLDTDNDGIGNVCDIDDDGDGVLDVNDNCPLTINPNQEDADNDGVGDVCDSDADNDGVPNSSDQCPETTINAVVDANGCEVFSLPSNNYRIRTTSESCISSNNGRIDIEANQSLNYSAVLTGNGVDMSSDFTATTIFDNLASGNYSVCITIDSRPNYINCSDVIITAPEPLGVGSKIDGLSKQVTLNLTGAHEYIINLNGIEITTTKNEITLSLSRIENTLFVKTSKDCQGVYQENIVLGTEVYIYPNPIAGGNLTILSGESQSNTAVVSLFSINGTRLFSKLHTINNQKILFNVDSLSRGIYILNVKTENTLSSYKIIRK